MREGRLKSLATAQREQRAYGRTLQQGMGAFSGVAASNLTVVLDKTTTRFVIWVFSSPAISLVNRPISSGSVTVRNSFKDRAYPDSFPFGSDHRNDPTAFTHRPVG